MNETDADDDFPELPDDAEEFLAITFYLDSDGDMYTLVDGNIPTLGDRDNVVSRLEAIAESFNEIGERANGYH